MSVAASDPYYSAKTDVTRALAACEDQHMLFGAQRRRKRTPVSADEVLRLYRALTASLEAVEADLFDVEASVKMVETNRGRFRALDDAEVASRRAFVRNSRRSTQSIRTDLTSHHPASCGTASPSGVASAPNERVGLLAPSPASPLRDGTPRRDSARGAADSALVDCHQVQQLQQVEQQEETLTVLGEAVGRLKNLGGAMNDELGAHNIMMRDIDSQIDAASGSMGVLKAKMAEMAESKGKDRGKLLTILILSGVLFAISSIVLYT